MRLQKKSYSRVTLLDLLRRRRTNLSKFISDNGIVTIELLNSRCESMGVIPPSEDEFLKARGSKIPTCSSPSEGVVVVLPTEDILCTKEAASKHPFETSQEIASEPLEQQVDLSLKKKKKKDQTTI